MDRLWKELQRRHVVRVGGVLRVTGEELMAHGYSDAGRETLGGRSIGIRACHRMKWKLGATVWLLHCSQPVG